MAKLRRAIAPEVPHHVTQRGNRRQPVFFGDDDFRLYVKLLGEHCRAREVAIWAWCLMPNHVHLILVPPSAEAMTTAIADTHRRYSFVIRRRQKRRGNLWRGQRTGPAQHPLLISQASRTNNEVRWSLNTPCKLHHFWLILPRSWARPLELISR